MRQAHRLNQNDLLIARTGGTIGKSFQVDSCPKDAVFASYLIRIVPSHRIYEKYFKNFADSALYWKQLREKSMGTGQPNVNGTSLSGLLFPVPPYEEQKRIVAKVDQLMALCDELEAKQEKQTLTRRQLNDAALNALLSAASPEEFENHWQRIVDNFDLLYDDLENLKPFRQAIMKMAVQGKVVAQDIKEQPAINFLKKIENQKRALINKGRLKKTEDNQPSSCEKSEIKLPVGWEIRRFGEITINRDGERIPVSREEREPRKGQYDYYGASGVIDSIDEYLFDKPLLLIGEDGANLINRSTPIAFIAKGKYWVNNHAHVIDGFSYDYLRYLEVYINQLNLEAYVTGTAQPKMNQQKMNSILVLVPPEEEQKRIVAKVDQLMALCDELEKKLAAKSSHLEKLTESNLRV